MSGYSPMQAGTTGLLTAYEPTWKDRIARALMGDSKPSPERARLVEGLAGSRGMGTTGMGLLDFIPVAGQLLQAQEAIRSGDTDMLAMALMPGSKQVKAATGSADDAAKAGIRAYHGSPHDFDKFDMSKIGTGEGAQAYGHGLYFAEAEGVAKQYRDALGPARAPLPKELDAYPEDVRSVFVRYASRSDDQMSNAKWAQNFEPRLRSVPTEQIASTLEKVADARKGRMYEVRINASPDDFLDWDKPLSQQSEKVRGAAESALGYKPDIFRGDEFVRALELERGGNAATGTVDRAAATAALRDAGIPGIRYLDQGSRTAGEGSRNYVVFRDDIIDIVRKYGIAAAASMYGMDRVNAAMAQEQPKQKGLLP